ncbi:hypothetical protein AAII07_54955 [Microvirga sp. 0TCS3.31]
MTLTRSLIRKLRRSLLISVLIGAAKVVPLIEIALRFTDFA